MPYCPLATAVTGLFALKRCLRGVFFRSGEDDFLQVLELEVSTLKV